MSLYDKAHMLDGLDQLSIENLQAGRITCSAMAYAVQRCGAENKDFLREKLGGCMGGGTSDRLLADMLNDMFGAARFLKEKTERTAGPRCVKCGKSFDDHDDETCPPGNKMLAVGEEHAYVVLANHNKMLMYAVEPEGIEAWRLRNLTLSSIEENGLMGMAHNPNLLTPTNHIILSERDVESAMHDYYRTRALKTKQAAPRDWICTKCGQSTRDHNIDGSCRHVCLPDPQEKKYKYRVVYSDASGMPVEWLTNKVEQHGGSVIRFQDHNGKTQICFSKYKVTDLMPEQPASEENTTHPPRKKSRYGAVKIGEGYNIIFDKENPPPEEDIILGHALLQIARSGSHAILISSITPDRALSLVDAVGDETVRALVALGDKWRTRADKHAQEQSSAKAPWDWLCNKCGQRFSNEQVSAARGSGTPACLNCGTEMICYKKAVTPEQPAAEDECPSCHNGTLERVGDELRCRGECGGIFATCPNCGRGAPKHYGMVVCDGCGANWPEAQKSKIDKVLDTLHLKPKKKITMDDLKKVSWDGMAEDVSKRIHLLGSLSLVADRTPLIDKIAEDLILPNIRLLAEFCENVEIKE